MKEWHAISCSGGKDSTALVLKAYETGMHIDEVIGCNEGYWWPEAIETFWKLAEYTSWKFTLLEPDDAHKFDHIMFDYEPQNGKHVGEKGLGWPTPINRWCTSTCKARVIDRHFKALQNDGYQIHQYIGIAADEAERAKKDAGIDKTIIKHYPLIDWGMSESDCLKYCYEHGFDFGGLYEHFTRISCWCCPFMTLKQAKATWKHYPDKWAQLKDMDARAKNQFKQKWTVAQLEERFRREEESEASQMALW